MSDNNIDKKIGEDVKKMEEGVTEVLEGMIDNFKRTWPRRYIKKTRKTLKRAITVQAAKIREVLEGPMGWYVKENARLKETNSEYEKKVSDLTSQVETTKSEYEKKVSLLLADLRDNQQEYVLLLKSIIELIPKDEQGVLETRLYELAKETANQEDAEDKENAVEIGQVTSYSPVEDKNLPYKGVAEITLSEQLTIKEKVWNEILIEGETTYLTQSIESMLIEDNSVTEANVGDVIKVNVLGEVKEGDNVYKLPELPAIEKPKE